MLRPRRAHGPLPRRPVCDQVGVFLDRHLWPWQNGLGGIDYIPVGHVLSSLSVYLASASGRGSDYIGDCLTAQDVELARAVGMITTASTTQQAVVHHRSLV